MTILHAADALTATPSGATMPLSDGFLLHIDHLDAWLVRIAIVPEAGFSVDRTWMIAPNDDAPWEGRDRLATDGFPCPAATLDDDGWLTGERLRILAGLPGDTGPFALQIERHDGQAWRPLLADRPTGAYQWLERRRSFRHFQARDLTERHYGLGDKTGPLDRTGRRLRCLQIDTLGYDAETTDPLYKHAPWLIVDHPERGAAGLLYDTLAETTFDLGAEHSNYHPHYRHMDAAEPGMVLYVVDGPRVADIVPRLHALTGRPHLPPRWAMGFAFTTMHHADAADAQGVMTRFVDRARAENIPLSALHSGSGYTRRSDGRRYVFHWSDTRFPDRDGFFAHLTELGLRSAANVKPVLLTEHPAYADSAAEGRFVKRADGSPAVEMFWGGPGSQLDFTHPSTVRWWQAQLTAQILDAGFTAAWNDNNEAELWDETATIDGFGHPLPAIEMRPVHALLMTRASFEATRDARPGERPYTITRAGPIGLARYAETWTGDNATSWKTLRWNLRQALSMSLSGMPFTGHDIGGFDGPRPDAELLIRWVQMMALHPRCVMNSWKPQLVAAGIASGEADCATLPWLYRQATPHVREALRLRYRLLPYLYHLAHRAHAYGEPLMAPSLLSFRRAGRPRRGRCVHARSGRARPTRGRTGRAPSPRLSARRTGRLARSRSRDAP